MIRLYDKTYTTEYGTFDTLVEAFVEEERNGLFELSFIVLNTDNLFNYIKEENIVVTDANDTLLNQKFRIYMTRKLMNNKVEVFARHISFDLMYDYIDNLSFTNQSCQYALNQLFINSNFSKHYKGYSNIVNAQNYKMSMANILEAIGGKSGSIIDTFGTGAELLRDNENIHVLNRRGNDNEVTIEYRKNLIGFELEEDTTDLVTKILPYAKYNNEETSEEITVKADFIDSPLINNYSHPYIKAIDYSEKFEEGEIPTVEKLITFAKNEYKNNKVDIPKQNFKIDFIPLSKCIGYEGLEDKISLCDTVTIIDTRYNINTQAKVIKTVFNVLKNRYESIELGEPKTSLGDIIGSGGNDEPVVGPPGPPGPPGQDGNLGDFPNSLPNTPILESFLYGFSNIELSWTFENKIYYQYELYASKVKDFIPNTFDLIFQGQASSYMFQAKPNETWYFKVCAINTYGERTEFSNQVTVTTTKIEDLSNYVENMAIGEALIGKLSLDRAWIGKLNANLLDVKGNFSVTDGNGKRTLDIDSFGNVNLDCTTLKIKAGDVATQSQIDILDQKVTSKVSADDVTSIIEQNPNSIKIGFNEINDNIQFSESEMQINTSNGKSLTLKNGRLNTYNWTDGKVTGYIGQAYTEINGKKYPGQVFGGSYNCYYTTFGLDSNYIYDTDTTGQDFSPFITLVYWKYGDLSRGIYFNQQTDFNHAPIVTNLKLRANPTGTGFQTKLLSFNSAGELTLDGVKVGGTSSIAWDNVTNKPTSYPTSWNNISSKPSEFTPSKHLHSSINNNYYGMTCGSSGVINPVNGDEWIGYNRSWARVDCTDLYYTKYNGISTKDIKSDIKYLINKNVLNFANLYNTEKDIDREDFYNLIKNINFATFIYDMEKAETGAETLTRENNQDELTCGFIMEDLEAINNPVVDMIVKKTKNKKGEYETDSVYSKHIDMGAYHNTIAIALQVEIEKREKLEERVKELEELVNKLLEKGEI